MILNIMYCIDYMTPYYYPMPEVNEATTSKNDEFLVSESEKEILH